MTVLYEIILMPVAKCVNSCPCGKSHMVASGNCKDNICGNFKGKTINYYSMTHIDGKKYHLNQYQVNMWLKLDSKKNVIKELIEYGSVECAGEKQKEVIK